jgi:uncharacterized protein
MGGRRFKRLLNTQQVVLSRPTSQHANMLFLLSPAKTLNFELPSPFKAQSTPPFVSESTELINVLKTKSVEDIAALMALSRPLAALNVGRYGIWSPRFTARNSKAALFAFNGDVYEGLSASTLSAADVRWANQHVAILSGLYGVLRPLDRMQPYRLEMGTALANSRGKNLYAFWGDSIALHLNQLVKTDASPVIVNLASQEYFKAAGRKALKPRVIECVFEDWKTDRYKVIGFFAKRARGLMLRHAITQRLVTPDGLKDFSVEEYSYALSASEPDRLVFRRRVV